MAQGLYCKQAPMSSVAIKGPRVASKARGSGEAAVPLDLRKAFGIRVQAGVQAIIWPSGGA
jgi:hypothetical protein